MMGICQNSFKEGERLHKPCVDYVHHAPCATVHLHAATQQYNDIARPPEALRCVLVLHVLCVLEAC